MARKQQFALPIRFAASSNLPEMIHSYLVNTSFTRPNLPEGFYVLCKALLNILEIYVNIICKYACHCGREICVCAIVICLYVVAGDMLGPDARFNLFSEFFTHIHAFYHTPADIILFFWSNSFSFFFLFSSYRNQNVIISNYRHFFLRHLIHTATHKRFIF